MKTAVGIALGAFLAISAEAQIAGSYLDYYTVKVKPEKMADFEAIARKIVEANRKNILRVLDRVQGAEQLGIDLRLYPR